MTIWDILLQQIINGVSLGAMYALLALGFTMVYGIIELINFAHFNVFMVGSFVGLWLLEAMGIAGQGHPLYGLPLIGVLLAALVATMLITGILGVVIERVALRPMRNVPGTAAMITTIRGMVRHAVRRPGGDLAWTSRRRNAAGLVGHAMRDVLGWTAKLSRRRASEPCGRADRRWMRAESARNPWDAAKPGRSASAHRPRSSMY